MTAESRKLCTHRNCQGRYKNHRCQLPWRYLSGVSDGYARRGSWLTASRVALARARVTLVGFSPSLSPSALCHYNLALGRAKTCRLTVVIVRVSQPVARNKFLAHISRVSLAIALVRATFTPAPVKTWIHNRCVSLSRSLALFTSANMTSF